MAEDEGTGAVDEGGDEDERPESEGQESQDDGQEAEAGTPEEVLAERDKLRKTLARIKETSAKHRRELAALKAEQAKKADDGKEAEADAGNARVARLAGVTALVAEGLTKAQAKVAVRLLDLSEVEVDDDGDADFEDAIAELKEAFPGMFAKQEQAGTRRAGGRVSTADKGGSKTKEPSTSDRLLRAAGYR